MRSPPRSSRCRRGRVEQSGLVAFDPTEVTPLLGIVPHDEMLTGRGFRVRGA